MLQDNDLLKMMQCCTEMFLYKLAGISPGRTLS